MTVNGKHLIDDILTLCGGRNVFAGLTPLVPIISTEAVVAVDPEAILTAERDRRAREPWRRDPGNPSFAAWHRHRSMTAVRRSWLYALNGDTISRQGPRVVDGAAAVCAVLDQVRARARGALAPSLRRRRRSASRRASTPAAPSRTSATTAHTSHSGRLAWQT